MTISKIRFGRTFSTAEPQTHPADSAFPIFFTFRDDFFGVFRHLSVLVFFDFDVFFLFFRCSAFAAAPL
jgi:hypothetical protein